MTRGGILEKQTMYSSSDLIIDDVRRSGSYEENRHTSYLDTTRRAKFGWRGGRDPGDGSVSRIEYSEDIYNSDLMIDDKLVEVKTKKRGDLTPRRLRSERRSIQRNAGSRYLYVRFTQLREL